MKTVFLDTNIFLRFFTEKESRQGRECRQLFLLMEKNKLKGVICAVVLLEIYFTLKSFYRYATHACAKRLERILELRNLKIDDRFDYAKALELIMKKGVKFNDCLIASLKFFETGGVIISYDRDFDKLGLRRAEPKELTADN